MIWVFFDVIVSVSEVYVMFNYLDIVCREMNRDILGMV